MTRDPLGCNALFYGVNNVGELVVASRISQALDLGVRLDVLASCPPGHIIRYANGESKIVSGAYLSSAKADENFDLRTFQSQVLDGINQAFVSAKAFIGKRRAVVCLSGGLDSSVIAAKAKEYLDDVVAISFSYLSSEDYDAWSRDRDFTHLQSVSDDFKSARAVADALDIPLLAVFRPREAVKDIVEISVSLCQDWRDFNVHCAVVNLFLAEDISTRYPDDGAVVLTGDLMNEYVCDYHEEKIGDTVYYPQPRVSLAKRRSFYVRGLDAGDREVGVFNAYGLPVLQLYAAVADCYMTIPSAVLERPDAKETLNAFLLPPAAREQVNKSKQRAQIGGADGGTLGIFHNMGVDQNALAEIWMASLPEVVRGDSPLDIIQFGRYRTTKRET
jgi:asparagine synthetase B (glutamine-hydrolysing)